MELAMMIINYLLKHESAFMTERTYVTLTNAVKLMNAMPEYEAEDIIKALFGEEEPADAE